MAVKAKTKKDKNNKDLKARAKTARRPARKAKAATPRAIHGVRTKSTGRAFARPEVPNVPGVTVQGAMDRRYDEILTAPALAFVADLHRKFDATRQDLLRKRMDRQHRFDAGELPDFLAETRDVRERDWKIGAIPKDLLDRRVELTGPVDRKMVINALNSGAEVYMADFEDACSPTWANLIDGQINLKDRWSGKLDFTDPQTKKSYKLGNKLATLIVRPRGWHLVEEHVLVDGAPVAGALFDFGLYLFHNAKSALKQKSGPYFYLPKLENHLEARLWNDVFVHAQGKLGLPRGTIKSTILIETLPAAFEMDEILYEQRDHITGLNCGRWDYIFSFIKRLGRNKRFLTPDRGVMGMDRSFLRAYSLLLIKTCHRRGAYRHGRHGGADPGARRSAEERDRFCQGARRQGARGQRRPRRHLGGAPGPGAGGEASVRQDHEGAEPAREAPPRREGDARPDARGA